MTEKPDIRDLLPLYALGALEPDEATAVERAVAADPALATELAACHDAAHALAAAPPGLVPSPDVKARLLASAGAGRFERFAAQIAKVVDVTLDRARALLGLVARPASWEQPLPGISLVHFTGGPACATADCGFVQIAPGCTFPWHKHLREEVSVMIAGTVRDSSGKLYGPGDEMRQAAGSEHELTAEGNDAVIFLAVAFDGIELGRRP